MRRPCPHELWLALDLDGDLDDGKRDGNAAWKGRYDRYTLRVSWPASVSFPTDRHFPLLEKKKKEQSAVDTATLCIYTASTTRECFY